LLKRWICLVLTAALAWAAAGPAAAQVDSTEVVDVRAVWNKDAARPGDQRVLAVVFDMEPGFHIRPDLARLPEGEPEYVATKITVTQAGESLTAGPVQWPKLHQVKVQYTDPPSNVATIGDGDVAYIPITIADDAAAGDQPLKLTVHYQSCDDRRCYAPADQTISAPLTLGDDQAVASANAGDGALFENFDRGVFAEMNTGYSGPNYITFNPFGWFGEGLRLDAATSVGFALMLTVAALGGLLLNFTPCVLPVIPLKIMGLAQHAGNRSRTLLLGGIMAAGVAAFWAALGGAIAVTGYYIQQGLVEEGAGVSAANELFQYPSFTIAVGVIIALMAVGMCGLFTMQLPRWVYTISPSQDSVAGSFGFGIMTAVLSTPCTAPFMGAAAGWAAGQPAAVTMATFLAIGAGMALPYFILSASPKLVEKMPRTGPGSELLKQVLGLLMLAAAAFFVGNGVSLLFNEPPDPPSLAYWWVVGALVAAAGGWLIVRVFQITGQIAKKYGPADTHFAATRPRIIWTMVGLVFILVAGAGASSLDDRGPIDWQYYTPDRFEQAKQRGQVVVMDFTADWCLNCKALEHAVLFDQRVVEALEQPGVVPMKVDITNRSNKVGQAMLKKVDRVTIPLLVVFSPDGEEVFKSDAYGVSQVLGAIEKAKPADNATANAASPSSSNEG
jgi:thiol:disulfide interchange protein DsbD